MKSTRLIGATLGMLLIGMVIAPAHASARVSGGGAPGATEGHHLDAESRMSPDEIEQRLHEDRTHDPKLPHPEAVPGELLVTYKVGASASAKSAVAADVDGRIRPTGGMTDVLEVDPGSTGAARKHLAADARVEHVEPNYLLKVLDTPNDPRFPVQVPDLALIRAPQAWDVTRGRVVKVAVIDSGIDTDHPDLTGRIAVAENFVGSQNNGNPSGDPSDTLGHGTAVAGIIAATANNGIGISGVAPKVRLYSLKVVDDTGYASALDTSNAIGRAIALNVDVINLSVGTYANSYFVENALDQALERGIAVVAAAGNGGSPFVSFPASHPGVLSVGAVDSTGDVAAFSNHGGDLDVVAPGVNVTSTKLTPGAAGGYGTFSGTSYAAAFATGVVALLPPTSPQVVGGDLAYDVERTAQDRGMPGFDHSYGWGVVDAVGALHAGQASGVTTEGSGPDSDGDIDHATTVSSPATAAISPPGDEDWFKLTVPSSGRMQVTVTPPVFVEGRVREMDPIVEVYDSSKHLLRAQDRMGPGEPEALRWNATAGTIYVRVANYAPSASPADYTVTLTSAGAFTSEGYTAATTLRSKPPMGLVYAPKLADLTGDGDLDYVDFDTETQNLRLGFRPGNGDGTFGNLTTTTLSTDIHIGVIAVGDLDDDGDDDLLVEGTPDVVFWGTPSGPVLGPDTPTYAGATIADLDGDGRAEIIDTAISSYEWNGSTFVKTDIALQVFTPAAVASGDIDGDSLVDIIVSPSANNPELMVLSRITGTWAASTTDIPGNSATRRLRVGDFTRDGVDEVLLTVSDYERGTVLYPFVSDPGHDLVALDPMYLLEGSTVGLATLSDEAGPVVVAREGSDAIVYRFDGTTLRYWEANPFVVQGEPIYGDVDADGLDDVVQEIPYGPIVLQRHLAHAATPPGLLAWSGTTSPRNNTGSVSTAATLTLSTQASLLASTVNGDHVWVMEGQSGYPAAATVTLDAAHHKITVDPTKALMPGRPYTLVVAGVKDSANHTMPLQLVNFRTTSGPMPTITVNGTYTPITAEFDGDEGTDVFWYSNGGNDVEWHGTAAGIRSSGPFAGWPSGMRIRFPDMVRIFTASTGFVF